MRPPPSPVRQLPSANATILRGGSGFTEVHDVPRGPHAAASRFRHDAQLGGVFRFLAIPHTAERGHDDDCPGYPGHGNLEAIAGVEGSHHRKDHANAAQDRADPLSDAGFCSQVGEKFHEEVGEDKQGIHASRVVKMRIATRGTPCLLQDAGEPRRHATQYNTANRGRMRAKFARPDYLARANQLEIMPRDFSEDNSILVASEGGACGFEEGKLHHGTR
jgi:hypothetical protein